jgi:hypothetical protein
MSNKNIKTHRDLIEVEDQIAQIFDQHIGGILLEEEKAKLNILEESKRRILDWDESQWRTKSRAVWPVERDENTMFFQNYSKHRKNINTI